MSFIDVAEAVLINSLIATDGLYLYSIGFAWFAHWIDF